MGQKRAHGESWSAKNTGVLREAKARDPVSPEREGPRERPRETLTHVQVL